ncbi:MAG: hypothetical protein V1723_01670 [Candidatus Uhrbacteria bacterium]
MSDSRGDTIISWAFSEYTQHERGRWWYIAAAVIAALLIVYSFASRNFLFAVIIVMIAIALYLRHVRQPVELTCTITERGVQVGDDFLAYDSLRNFWILDRADSPRTLYVDVRGLRGRLVIPLGDLGVEEVRAALRERLPEDTEQHDEPAADAIGRMLKL